MPCAFEPLAPDILATLRKVSVATLSSQLRKHGLRATFLRGVRALNPSSCRFVGEAYTLRFIPMREDISKTEILSDPDYPPRKAIEAIPLGQVLVIDCRGEDGAGVAGDILVQRLKVRGAAALVTDGAVRDAEGLFAIGFPIFCKGAAAPPSLSLHYGADLQRPIACGGTAIFPGDILAGDADGVVVLPRQLAAEIARQSEEQETLDRFLKERIAAGAPTIGTYPPDARTIAEYRTWRLEQGGAVDR